MNLKLKIFLTILVLSVTLPISAHDFQQVNSDGKTIYYNITSNTNFTVGVTYKGNSYNSYSNEYEGIVNIPSLVEYNGNTYSVTSIGYEAFYGCSGLNEITIPNSVNSIGGRAFENCSELMKITIPNSVNSIGGYAFYNCSGLKDLIIEDSNETLSLDSNGSYESLFYNCNLETLYLGRNISWSRFDSPFENIKSLKSVTIGNNVTSIGSCAFSGCSGLTEINIPNSVTSIGEWAFENCSKLTEITIPSSVTSIEEGAFINCSELKYLIIEDSNETLPLGSNGSYGLFDDCKLETLYLGRDISYSSIAPPFKNKKNLKSVTLGNSVTSIGYEAFYGCSGLYEITIPNSITSIGDYAFYGCSGLNEITIPNRITSIGDYAFYGCI